MKRWVATLIVLVVFAALLAYVILVESKTTSPPEPGATPSPTPASVLNLLMDDVRAVRITDSARALRFAHDSTGWRMTEPKDADVDTYTVFLQMDELVHLDARLIVSEETSDLQTFGLDPAALTLVIESQDGSEEWIHVGRETPDGTTFYVLHDGDPRLYIVDHYKIEPFFEWLSSPPYPPTPTS